MSSLIEIYREGGVWMHLITIIGVMAIAVFIERFIALYIRFNIDKDKFIANVQRSIIAGDLNSAVNHCNDRQTPLNQIVKAGLIAVMNQGDESEIQTSMDVAALREIPKIEKRTPFLALFGNVATLLGLFSTIVGLIVSFKAVSAVDPSQKAVLLARGISEAMNGTAYGLSVAIPSLLLGAFLTARTQSLLDDVHEVSVSTLNLILQNRDKFPSVARK
jgi:biopolymer transport protein ExbB